MRMTARYIKYTCHCVVWKVLSQKVTMPKTHTAQRDTPEHMMIHQPIKVIQPTTKTANRFAFLGANMNTKWY